MIANRPSLVGKKLLLLDGSQKAVEIIEEAHKLGLNVVVTDYNSTDESPAKLVADEYFQISTSDVSAVVELIRREGISGVLPGFSDRWLPVYAEICEASGLPTYADSNQLKLFTDKRRYKALLQAFDIPVIEGFSVEEALDGLIPEERFPILVKPADGSGSRGITVCRSQADVCDAVSVAREYSWTDEVIVERYLPGQEATVHWVFQDGQYHVSLLWNRHMMTFGEGRFRLPVAYSSPSSLIPSYMKTTAPRVREMLASVGIQNGMMFMQCIVRGGVLYTYDIGYRVTPTQEYRIIEDRCGYNPLSMLINFAVTGAMGEPELKSKVNPDHPGYGFNVSSLITPGTVRSFSGLDDVRSWPGVLSVSPSVKEGATLPPESLGQLRQIAVRTVGVTETKDALYSSMMEISNAIDVRGDNDASLKIGAFEIAQLEGLVR